MPDHFRLPDGSDARLREARALIDDEAVSVLSLDVFDTLLWRKVPRPTDAFLVLGHRLHDSKALPEWVTPEAFRRLRIEAEAEARQRRRAAGGGEEVALRDIYAMFAPGLLHADAAELEDAEVRVERELTVVDLDVLALADLAAGRGCRIVLVSNTYLRPGQLAQLVQRPEAPVLTTATLFPSCAYGVHKANGLWDVVLRELDVAPTRILHVGDEAASDVDVPTSKGIRVAHFRRDDAETLAVLGREGALPAPADAPSGLVVHPIFGDLGTTAVRSKVVMKADLTEMPAGLAAAWRYGAQVLGPVFTGFADWVVEWAVAAGHQRVWCLMREGEFLADLVNRSAQASGAAVEAVPLWLSRHATVRASLYRADADELRTLLSRRLRPFVREWLATLGLGIGEVPELRGVAERRLDDPALVERVVAVVAGSDHLRHRVLEESAAARERLLRYLRSSVGDTDVLPMVDLGWGGTIQTQLDTTLAIAGVPLRTVGLYLATNQGCTGRVLAGREMHGYLTAFGEPSWASHTIARSPEVIEQVSLSSTGSLVDFTDDGHPVRDGSVPPADQVMSKLATQRGVRAFQLEWERYRAAAGSDLVQLPAAVRAPMLCNVLVQSILRPTRVEVATFGAWTHEDNFGAEGGRERIVPEELGRLAPYLTPPDLLSMPSTDAFWPMGMATATDPVLAAQTGAVLSGALAATTFDPDRHELVATCHVGTDTTPVGAFHSPMRVNRNGLSYARFKVEAPGITVLHLAPVAAPAVVRIDWIEIAGTLEGGASVALRLDTERDFAGLTYSGCKWLYQGVVLSPGSDPRVILPLGRLLGGPCYRLDVQLACAVTLLPGPSAGVDLAPADFGTHVVRTVEKVRAELAAGGMPAVRAGARRVLRRVSR
ncbi:MAG TPA: hypothetical protein VFP61_13170 [Acidimicrobiales bacterium]|nr:hypothetical protein [Acidimicrobiales bacterium]